MKTLAAFALILAASTWPRAAGAVDVLTYHNDTLRTGWNSAETALTPASIGSSSLRKTFEVGLDSISLTEPLIATAELTSVGKRDLLIVGTDLDTVYALNAKNGRRVWKVSLVPAGGTAVPESFTGCPSLPTVGITSTPVIDRALDTIWVVAADLEGPSSNQHMHYRLHALALGTGLDRVAPVEITASPSGPTGALPFDADVETQRSALLEANGRIYVTFGGTCDYAGNLYHGWIFAYDPSSLAFRSVFVDTPIADGNGNYMAGIWMSGNGPAANANGTVFAVTGNGHFDRKQSFGDSVVALRPNLSRVIDYFTPDTVATDNANDADFGSGGLMLAPELSSGSGPSLAFAQGKDGIFTMMNSAHLGGYHPGRDNVLAELSLGGVWSSPAYFDAAGVGEFAFATGGPLYQIALKRQPAAMNIVAQTNEYFSMGNGNGATPVITSSGANEGTAIVWIVQWNNGSMRLLAYPVSNLSAPIVSFPIGRWNQYQMNNTMIPTVANGYAYVVGLKRLYAFSLH